MKNTWQNPNPKYNLPLILSVAVHVAIVLLLVASAPVTTYRMNPSAASQKPVIHAVAVDLAAVNAQVQNIQARDAALKAQEQERVRQLQAQADAARQTSAVEAQRLAQLKIEQQRVQQQREQAARQAQLKQQAQVQAMQIKALAIKKQQQEAQAKAKALKNQQELAAKQNALQQQLMQQQIANEQKQLLHDQQMRQMQGVVDQYRAKILMAIANQWLIPDDVDPSLACVFTIDLTPSGVVSRAQLVRSSGNAALDRAAQAAIYKASPLPVPKDPAAFNPFRHFTLKMTPQDIVK